MKEQPLFTTAILRYLALSVALTLCSVKNASGEGQAERPSVDLSGEWEFKLDPLDVGRAEKWFLGAQSFHRKVRVPGAWNAQGAGFESEEQLRKYEDERLAEQGQAVNAGVQGTQGESSRLFHVYPGPAWYRTKVTIPANWRGKIPWLIFKGVHREAEVWVNSKQAGEHRSYLTPLRIDLSPYAKAGETITIVARVDARRQKELDPLSGTLDTSDFLLVTWGGIYRNVVLEATEATWMDDVSITPNLARETAEIRVTINGAKADRLTVAAEIVDAKGASVAAVRETAAGEGNETVLQPPIAEAKLWSPQTPYLYTARVRLLSGDKVLDARSIRFGMREFKVEGENFLLNGKPIFLRGYGDDCIFPNTICPPPDKSAFRQRLSRAREYGFNFVRHHSWTPPEEYFDAADELGMMLQPEFPFMYRDHLPATPEAKRIALEEWQANIRLHRNHPSIVAWCRGNELYDVPTLAPEMYESAKRLDPTRPVIDTDGCRFNAKDRKTLDYLVIPFGEEGSIGYQDGKYNFSGNIGKPVVAHEMGYFVTLPDLDQLSFFKGGLRPYWLLETRDIAERKGLLGVYPEWLAASYRLQALCLKCNIEAARRSRLKGTSVWLFQDYPNCAEGVVDMFFRRKGIRPEEFRKFNSPTVILLEAPRRNWWNGETAEIKFVVSRFEDAPSDAAKLHWTLKRGKVTLAEGVQEKLHISADGLQELPSIQLKIPAGKKAEQLTLAAELTDEDGRTDNSWNLWSFPKEPPVENVAKVRTVGCGAWLTNYSWAQEYSGGAIPPGTELIVSTKLDKPIKEYLSSGGRVLLLEPEPAFATEKANFRLAAWDGHGPSGTIFDPKLPALRAMPSEGWCDLQFFSLIQGSKTVRLDSLPTKIQPLVRCIDRPTRLADRAFLFEASVGQGKLLVSSFNFASAIVQKDPAGVFLLDQLVRYALGPAFAPRAALPIECLKDKGKK